MAVLGIETSCDETAAAVVEETGDAWHPGRVRSSIVASQVEVHREWGGIVPELSARQHVRDICGVVERALADAGVSAYDAIAVTQGPGLVGSLLVGLAFAKALVVSQDLKPLSTLHRSHGINDVSQDHSRVDQLEVKINGPGTFQCFNDAVAPLNRFTYLDSDLNKKSFAVPAASSAQIDRLRLGIRDIWSRIPGLDDLYRAFPNHIQGHI